MTDEQKLKLAEHIAATTKPACYYPKKSPERRWATHYALAAINALDPQLVEAVGLLREISEQADGIVQRLADRDMTESEQSWCAVFAAFRNKADAFLAKQGDA